MFGFLVHLTAVCIGISKDVSCKFNHYHLHAKAYSERRNVVGSGVVGSYDFALYATLSKAGTYYNAVQALQFFSHIVFGDVL